MSVYSKRIPFENFAIFFFAGSLVINEIFCILDSLQVFCFKLLSLLENKDELFDEKKDSQFTETFVLFNQDNVRKMPIIAHDAILLKPAHIQTIRKCYWLHGEF